MVNITPSYCIGKEANLWAKQLAHDYCWIAAEVNQEQWALRDIKRSPFWAEAAASRAIFDKIYKQPVR
jgi:hypothetical protein